MKRRSSTRDAFASDDDILTANNKSPEVSDELMPTKRIRLSDDSKGLRRTKSSESNKCRTNSHHKSAEEIYWVGGILKVSDAQNVVDLIQQDDWNWVCVISSYVQGFNGRVPKTEIQKLLKKSILSNDLPPAVEWTNWDHFTAAAKTTLQQILKMVSLKRRKLSKEHAYVNYFLGFVCRYLLMVHRVPVPFGSLAVAVVETSASLLDNASDISEAEQLAIIDSFLQVDDCQLKSFLNFESEKDVFDMACFVCGLCRVQFSTEDNDKKKDPVLQDGVEETPEQVTSKEEDPSIIEPDKIEGKIHYENVACSGNKDQSIEHRVKHLFQACFNVELNSDTVDKNGLIRFFPATQKIYPEDDQGKRIRDLNLPHCEFEKDWKPQNLKWWGVQECTLPYLPDSDDSDAESVRL